MSHTPWGVRSLRQDTDVPDAAGFFTYGQNPSLEVSTFHPLIVGRTRTPTAILDAKGSFIGKPSRRRAAEPTTDRPLGNPPTALSKDEKKVWRDLAKQALPGVLFESDRLMFAVLVRLAAKFYSGVPMMAAETAQMIQLSSKFALNPADRSKVSVEQPKQSALAAFITKREGLTETARVQ